MNTYTEENLGKTKKVRTEQIYMYMLVLNVGCAIIIQLVKSHTGLFLDDYSNVECV